MRRFWAISRTRKLRSELGSAQPAIYEKVVGGEKTSVFGTYRPLDQKKIDALPAHDQEVIRNIQNQARKDALKTVAIFPCIMFVCYVALIAYFQTQGGYKPKMLITPEEEEALITGGAEGPADL